MMSSLIGKAKTAFQLMGECGKRRIGCVPNVESTADSLAELLKTGGSISRFGDGELGTLFGITPEFQEYDEKLVSRLMEVLDSAGKNEPDHYVAIPYAMKSVRGLTKASKWFWLTWAAQNRHKLSVLYGGSSHFLDSQISRFYINRMSREESLHYLGLWQSLWNGKKVLLAEGCLTRFGVNNDLFDGCSTVYRVLCPAKNAWSSYESILETVVRAVESLNVELVLIALGPTATVLSFDLAKLGIQAIDVGNMDMEYEWFKRGSNEKSPIVGKYTYEVIGGDIVADVNDERYQSEIVAIIK